jgi:hypothetical protein
MKAVPQATRVRHAHANRRIQGSLHVIGGQDGCEIDERCCNLRHRYLVTPHDLRMRLRQPMNDQRIGPELPGDGYLYEFLLYSVESP